ncbi:MAG: hypothetical protein CMJ98_07955, partial [Planctomycetes bacterium]|nr:hypothetical protein [Planctomycetota bacterium]
MGAVPHLNKLAEELKDDEVQFLLVTDEAPAHIESFLKERSLPGWIGVDSNKDTFGRYGVSTIPATFVIDANGKLVLQSSPRGLTANLLRRIAERTPKPEPPRPVFIEPESFSERGGWMVDQQVMDLMGSPYVLAHGLGIPVPDCSGTVDLPGPGTYRVWVRTRDWVAPWNAPGAPGRFQVLLDGTPLKTVFGTEGEAWHWQDGGTCELKDEVQVSLHDLTGFEGRCDAILLSADTSWVPPHEGEELARLRTRCTSLGLESTDGGRFDLVVVGGGVAGTSAAITAARQGLKVALIQDRPVLGGNGSSEVRVWPEGHTNQEPYPHVGDVVSELIRHKGPGDGNSRDGHIYDDERKLALARAEPNLRLFLNQRVNAAEARDQKVTAVTAQHTSSGRRTRITGTLFLDSTGDGVLGALVGADHEITSTGHMGASNLWNVAATSKNEFQLRCECDDAGDPLSLAFDQSTSPAPFPRCPWAVDLSERDFPGRQKDGDKRNPLGKLGAWFWESGFDLDPIKDMERIRDLNLRAMYGAWDTLKNVDGLYPNHRLKWAAYVAGKRESRRLMGDVVLVGDDFRDLKPYPDAAFPCSWHLDLHFPEPTYHKDQDPFIAGFTHSEDYRYKGPYWAPYRALYSRNINNLFMAGRNISVNHEALGAVRVMKTCGMMGEVVGKAAYLCVRHGCDPRGVYTDHLDELLGLLELPGRARRETIGAALVIPPAPPILPPANPTNVGADPDQLAGLVIDESKAIVVGKWRASTVESNFVGTHYIHDDRSGKGAKSVRWEFEVPETGRYEVRLSYTDSASRDPQIPVTIEGAGKPRLVRMNQQLTPPHAGGFAT